MNMNDKGRKTWAHPMLSNDSETEMKEVSQNSEGSDDKNRNNGVQSTVAMTTGNCHDIQFTRCTGLQVNQ